MTTPAKGDFALVIDFDKGSPNPERVFMAMSNLITAFKKIDDSLIKSIDKNIQPILILEDVEIGSIKTWMRQQIADLDDNSIKKLNWKEIVGKYLVKAKYRIIDFLDGKTSITDAKEIKELQNDLYKIAEETDVNTFPAYAPISVPKLIDDIDKLNTALKSLNGNDKVYFKSSYGDATFNLYFNFVPAEIEDLLTKETLQNESVMILKVKRPDYLGAAQWEFKYDKRSIQVKILDSDWLLSFQQRKQDVRPGDSLKAIVKTTVKYGYDMNVVNIQYEILKVENVIRDESINPLLFEEDEE